MTTESTPDTTGTPERFSAWTLAKLAEPLNPSRVARDRDGNPYLEGWDAIAAANHDFGFDGWTSEIISIEPGGRFQATRDRGKSTEHLADLYVYTARIRVRAGGVTHEDVGTSPTATDTPEAHETAIKGAVTDGLKRALRQFGAQFGNDLYDKGRTGDAEPAPREQPRQAAPATAPREQPAQPAQPALADTAHAETCPLDRESLVPGKSGWGHLIKGSEPPRYHVVTLDARRLPVVTVVDFEGKVVQTDAAGVRS